MSLRAAAAVSLTGPYAIPGRDAAAGLRAWAHGRDVRLELHDDRGDPERVKQFYARHEGAPDILLGPYGSGATRAAVEAAAGSGAVLWNHGGAAVLRPVGLRLVDVLGPAERYWTGLGPALAGDGVDLARVLIARGESPFGRSVAAGAERSLRALGHAPIGVMPLAPDLATAVVAEARRLDASAVVGGGRIQDDLALGEALAGGPWAVGLVVCGIGLAGERLGDAVEGWLGPAQWFPGTPLPEFAASAVRDYPGAQAVAAGLLAERAIVRAGSTSPEAVWEAVRGMREHTFLGPFAVDDEGRQTAHAPLLVRWERGRGGLRRSVVWSPAAEQSA